MLKRQAPSVASQPESEWTDSIAPTHERPERDLPPVLLAARKTYSDETPMPSFSPSELVCLQIVPVKGQKREVASIMQLLNALSGVKPLSFEIVGLKNERLLLVRCYRRHVSLVKGQITSVYGSPEIIEVPERVDPLAVYGTAKYQSLSTLELARPAALPLRTYLELERNDPIMLITGASFDLVDEEVSVSQLVVYDAAPENWAAEYRQELLAIRRRQMGLLSGRNYLRLILLCGALGVASCSAYSLYWQAWFSTIAWGVVSAVLFWFGIRMFRFSDVEWSEAQEEMVARKIEMPAYQVELRLVAGAGSHERAERITMALANAYKVFSLEAGNSLVQKQQKTEGVQINLLQSITHNSKNLLGDEEIATLWHLPIVDMPDMMQVSRVNHVLPDKWQVAHEQDGWHIGEAQKSAGTPIPVWLPRNTARSHILLLGRTGMGKTTALEHIVSHVADKSDQSLVLIDPHGDMAKRILGLIPPHRVADTLYLDFSDPQHKPGFNPLDLGLYGGDPEKAALAIKEIAHTMFGRFWGPRMEMPFENAALAIALMNTQVEPDEQFTILNMLSLLELTPNARQSFLKDRLPPDELLTKSITQYFALHFDNLQKAFQEQVGMPVISKLEPFQRNSYLVDIFGQSQCSFDLVDDIKRGKIFILRTGAANLSREHSSFIGSLFLNVVIRAIYSQIEVPEAERTQVTIVVDESQTFKGVDYGTLLAEMRKFGANAILSVQGPTTVGRASASDEQDDSKAFQKIMENVDALFVFRTSGEAAAELSKTEFPNEATAADLINLEKYQSFVRYSTGRKVSGPFKVDLAPPLEPNHHTATDILSRRASYLLPVKVARERAIFNLNRIDPIRMPEFLERSGGVGLGEYANGHALPHTELATLPRIDSQEGIEEVLQNMQSPFTRKQTSEQEDPGSVNPSQPDTRLEMGIGDVKIPGDSRADH